MVSSELYLVLSGRCSIDYDSKRPTKSLDYYTATHTGRAIVSSTMSMKPSRKLQSIRYFLKHRASSQLPSSPSGPLTATPTSSSEPPDSLAGIGTFGNFIDGVDAPQTVAKTVYNGFKILLDVIDKVGYAVPPLKAAAAGIRSIMTVIDVCTPRATTTLELSTRVRM